jgi:hypothetical protein
MKKYIIIIGLVLFVLNTIIGLLISSYSTFNIAFVDFNILLSFSLFLILSALRIDSTYKITLTITFIFTGAMRLYAALVSDSFIQNNPAVIGVLIIFAIEIVLTIIVHSIKKIE